MLEPNFDLDDTFTVKDERAFWRRAVIKTFGVLGLILALIVFGIVMLIHNVRGAEGEQTATFPGGVSVTKRNEPCPAAILALIPPEYHHLFQGGSGIYDGAPYGLCWAEDRGMVVWIWSDGGFGRAEAWRFRVGSI